MARPLNSGNFRTTCGVSAAKTLGFSRVPYGFADVNRACHRWLIKHDEQYRRDSTAAVERSAAAKESTKLFHQTNAPET